MLTVAVGGDDEFLLRAFIQQILHATLEGNALACVGQIGNDVHHIVLRNGGKQVLEIIAAAVVHDDDFTNAGILQLRHVGRQSLVRLVGGNDHGCAECIAHVDFVLS